jgi:hypothetical protein
MDRWPVTLKQSSAVVQNYTIQQIDLHKLQKKKKQIGLAVSSLKVRAKMLSWRVGDDG